MTQKPPHHYSIVLISSGHHGDFGKVRIFDTFEKKTEKDQAPFSSEELSFVVR